MQFYIKNYFFFILILTQEGLKNRPPPHYMANNEKHPRGLFYSWNKAFWCTDYNAKKTLLSARVPLLKKSIKKTLNKLLLDDLFFFRVALRHKELKSKFLHNAGHWALYSSNWPHWLLQVKTKSGMTDMQWFLSPEGKMFRGRKAVLKYIQANPERWELSAALYCTFLGFTELGCTEP